MPTQFFQPASRRDFLAGSARFLGALSMAGTGVFTARGASADAFHLALLSDTHIAVNPLDEYRKFVPTENLKTALGQVMSARPEGLIINGDLARLSGEPGDYEALKQLLRPAAEQAPVYLVMGNHDDRTNFSKTFDKPSGVRPPVPDKHVLILEHARVRIIMLDSLLYPTKTPGLLGKAQRQWLAGYLESSDARPIALFVHHTLSDGDGDLLDVDQMFQVIRPHRKVKAIFYGHSHQYSFGRHQGVHLINLPAVGYNFGDTEPVGWVEATFTADGVNLTLNAIGGNRAAHGDVKALSWGA